MSASSLESKTVRPGSLGSYSYYHSNRRPSAPPPRPAYIAASRTKLIPRSKPLLVGLGILLLAGLPMLFSYQSASKQPAAPRASASKTQKAAPAPSPAAPGAAAAVQPAKTSNHCAANTAGKLILVSVSQRHLWACEAGKTVQQSEVITGMLAHESTLTPPGTYQITAKTTDTTLSGSDETGAWNDPVYYWMPFLSNQYGTYGFHDATWRADNAFGKVDPASSDASHGCVELPLPTSKWLYSWAPVGTSVTIEN